VAVLVLTRRTNQSIVIGADVTITIVEIRGEQVRLGISAPRHVSVYREEVLEQIRDQNRRAAELVGNDTSMLPRRSAPSEPLGGTAARAGRSKR
jgi:carbon storage regulator